MLLWVFWILLDAPPGILMSHGQLTFCEMEFREAMQHQGVLRGALEGALKLAFGLGGIPFLPVSQTEEIVGVGRVGCLSYLLLQFDNRFLPLTCSQPDP